MKVFHAAEVNLVDIAMQGRPSVTNDVLPHTHCDLYSYSAYDIIHYARNDPAARQGQVPGGPRSHRLQGTGQHGLR